MLAGHPCPSTDLNLISQNFSVDMNYFLTELLLTVAGTRTDLALKHVRHRVFSNSREGVPKIAVLITDGVSWYTQKTIHQAMLLKKMNVTIFTVAISNKVCVMIGVTVYLLQIAQVFWIFE